MTYRILVPEKVYPSGLNYLREKGYELKITHSIRQEDLCADIADCNAVIVRAARVTKEVIQSAPELRVITRHGVGYDNIDVDFAHERGIMVTFCPMGNINSVAEHTMLLILATARNLHNMTSGFWDGAADFSVRNGSIGMELEGKTLGIIGFGRIGGLVANKAFYGFGMKVAAFDPYVKQLPDFVERTDTIEALLSCGDFISIHMPLTPETRRLMGIRQFAAMKKEGIFINASRGELVCEEELIEALRTGVIKGAGIDVFETEPPAADNPLLSMKNVVATPHYAAFTNEALDRISMHCAFGIDDVFSGREPKWPVR